MGRERNNMTRREFNALGAMALGVPIIGSEMQRPVTHGVVAKSGSSLLNNLAAFWKFDEASGARVCINNAALNLTSNNGVSSATGVGGTGTAASFSGASQYLSIANNAALVTGNADFTGSIWVYIDSATTAAQILLWDHEAGGAGGWRLWKFSNDTIRFITFNSSGSQNAEVIAALPSFNAWHHIIFWYDAAGAKVNLRVDNGTAVQSAVTGAVGTVTGAMEFGRLFTGDRFLIGREQYAGFWKRALTTNEQTILYNGGAGKAYPF